MLVDADQLRRTVARIAHEIVERHGDPDRLALVGIHTRGVPLAARLAQLIASSPAGPPRHRGHHALPRRRRPRHARGALPVVGDTVLDFDVSERAVVLVDDVLYTGRTIRAAIDAIFDYGRPPLVQLAVLVDRGHRELPIRPDYVGKNLPTSRSQRVSVRLEEIDGADEVVLEDDAEVPP